jgi:mannosylglycoprotein endo-beta-mannosidase
MINRAWNVLCWNIRGLNDKDKWDSIRNKIEESFANIFCLQETKREDIDLQFIHNFTPKRFDNFDFCPSVGASGGILVCLASNHFSGSTVEKHPFAINLKMLFIHSQISWNLVVVYGPCRQPARDQFVQWLLNLQIEDDELGMLMGDFNFFRFAENRNKAGGNFQDSLIFNNIISHLGLIELPLKGRSYTWSNMQAAPLLEQIDWFFTFVAWTGVFPFSVVLPLARITCDHLPCRVQIGTNIPKANIFRFENFWLHHPKCLEQIKTVWLTPVNVCNSAHAISAKFKLLRRTLKLWSKNLSNLSKLIANCNMMVAFFDRLEEVRTLYPSELKFRDIIKEHIRSLLRMQNQYWKQRFTQRIMQFGDENTKFFHSMATERYRRNVIPRLLMALEEWFRTMGN